MGIVLWVLQVLLGLHTLMGAIWKFTTPVSAVPPLQALPPGVWLGLGVIEIPIAACLVVSAFRPSQARLGPPAAIAVAAVMVLYIGVALSSGTAASGEIAYWAIVAVLSALVAARGLLLRRA